MLKQNRTYQFNTLALNRHLEYSTNNNHISNTSGGTNNPLLLSTKKRSSHVFLRKKGNTTENFCEQKKSISNNYPIKEL